MNQSNLTLGQCFLLNRKIVIVYVYPEDGRGQHGAYAQRFVDSYNQFPAGIDHDTLVVCNGAPVTEGCKARFASLPNLFFLEHDDSGWDIGAYQLAARTVPCDMMVFLGGSTFFRRAGWLARMYQAFQSHGNAQYGAMGNRGNIPFNVWPHIRSTAFWCHPALLAAYPYRISRYEQRHPFEHGRDCFSEWVKRSGLLNWVITWTTEYQESMWDNTQAGFHRGDQSDLLAYDRICEPPYYNV